jgi:hypothetical protein
MPLFRTETLVKPQSLGREWIMLHKEELGDMYGPVMCTKISDVWWNGGNEKNTEFWWENM